MKADKTMQKPSKFQIIGVLSVTWLLAVVFMYFLRPAILPPVLNLEVEKEEDLLYRPWGNEKTFTEEGQSNGGELEEKEVEEEAWSSVDACKFVLVESIPEDLPYLPARPAAQPLIQSWMELLDSAQDSVHVASFYWSLTGSDIGVNDSSSQPGEELLEKLETLLARNVSLTIATSDPTLALNSTDLEVLMGKGAQVRKIPMKHLTQGVLHSKFWIVDMKHVYLGSANMDWRSLTQVKELGIVIYNCSSLAHDLEKTFQTYWILGAPGATIPKHWPQNYSTNINWHQPLQGTLDGMVTTAYFSASPPVLCPKGRTRDLGALLSLIRDAKDFLYASVMEYFPTSRFQHPFKYWPVIDNALREAAFNRHVPIRLLISCGKNSDPSMFPYLRSLQALTNPQANVTIDVKIFIIPVGNHSNIPFSRVNHSKYAVTEKKAYVGTSNWSEDYFTNTAGVGVIVNQSSSDPQHPAPTIQDNLRGIFERDWQSPYAISLEKLPGQQDCVWHA
ncbi:5'-3' exonuclease PLD4 [Monodelphis domestica]|uniref:spleen exonuclease n=1 Tax=Monodelphis domestica TaxID=13616 RepID=F6TEV9_MONDO|nr:5'-3' exonuclease PLD4 [Monodelphis domestica]